MASKATRTGAGQEIILLPRTAEYCPRHLRDHNFLKSVTLGDRDVFSFQSSRRRMVERMNIMREEDNR